MNLISPSGIRIKGDALALKVGSCESRGCIGYMGRESDDMNPSRDGRFAVENGIKSSVVQGDEDGDFGRARQPRQRPTSRGYGHQLGSDTTEYGWRARVSLKSWDGG